MIKDKQPTPETSNSVYVGTKKADVHANPDREDITPEFAAKCLRTSLACFILLLVLGYFIHDRYYLSDAFFVKKYQNRKSYDIVFVGDSRVIRGVDPKVFEEARKGLRVYNFGFSGLGIDLEVLEHAKRLIDKDSAIKTIAVAVSRPSLSTANASENGYLAVEEMTAIDRTNLSALGEYEGLFKVRPPKVTPIKTHENGFVFTGKVKTVESVTKRDEANAEDKETWVDPKQAEKLAKWIETTRQEGYRVVVFRVPTSKRMYEVESQKLALDVEALRTQMVQAGAEWIATPPYREDLVSYDGSHLAGTAAEKFSGELSKSILEPASDGSAVAMTSNR